MGSLVFAGNVMSFINNEIYYINQLVTLGAQADMLWNNHYNGYIWLPQSIIHIKKLELDHISNR